MPDRHPALPREPVPDSTPSIVHRGKDLRIPNTTPEQLAKTLLRGGAQPMPETKRRQAS